MVSSSAFAASNTIYTTNGGYYAAMVKDDFDGSTKCNVYNKDTNIIFRQNGEIQVYYKFRYFVPKSLWVKSDEAEPQFYSLTTKQTMSQTVLLPVKSNDKIDRLRLRAMSPTYNSSEDDINLVEVREALSHCN